jgi:hypothetical protein
MTPTLTQGADRVRSDTVILWTGWPVIPLTRYTQCVMRLIRPKATNHLALLGCASLGTTCYLPHAGLHTVGRFHGRPPTVRFSHHAIHRRIQSRCIWPHFPHGRVEPRICFVRWISTCYLDRPTREGLRIASHPRRGVNRGGRDRWGGGGRLALMYHVHHNPNFDPF